MPSVLVRTVISYNTAVINYNSLSCLCVEVFVHFGRLVMYLQRGVLSSLISWGHDYYNRAVSLLFQGVVVNQEVSL